MRSELVKRFISERACDQVLGYHDLDYQAGMGAILQDEFRQICLYDSEGQLSGYLPYREMKGPAGAIVNALPFFGPNGLIAARDGGWLKKLLETFRETVSRPEVLSAVIYTPFLVDPNVIGDIFKPDFKVSKTTQYLDLKKSGPWPAARRGDIKKAQKASFVVRLGQLPDIELLYHIYVQNCGDAGIPLKPRSYFELTMKLAMQSQSINQKQGPLWLTLEFEGRIVAGLLTMRGGCTASYTIPIAASEIRSLQPNSLLIDAAINMCRDAGYRYWNFESSPSTNDPVYRYKERWGSQSSAYEIQGIYPNGAARVKSLPPEELARFYSGYFAYPFNQG